jgi:hypothetical protein
MPKKQTSPQIAKLASQVLSGAVKPTPAQVKKLAGSALSQEERGKRSR